MSTRRQLFKMVSAVLFLAALSPLGLVIPWVFQSGKPWGEWSGEELRRLVGFVPEGVSRGSRLWSAPLSDYSLGASSGVSPHLSYLSSALAGAAIVAGLAFLIGKGLTRRNGK